MTLMHTDCALASLSGKNALKSSVVVLVISVALLKVAVDMAQLYFFSWGMRSDPKRFAITCVVRE